MTEKIEIALKNWAEKVLKSDAQWDTDQVHQAIQKLYEISVCHKILIEKSAPSSDLWNRQQAELKTVLETLTGTSKTTQIEQEEDLEVPPMMETIKNMVTEMPEPENYQRLFEAVDEPPVFVPKSSMEAQKEAHQSTPIFTEKKERKNLNDQFAKSISIDLNDRLAFIKHLFNENVAAYEAVISQVVTFDSWEEVQQFIETKVKIEYAHWKDKEAVELRFMATLQTNFNA
jgi:hypothetical protein